MPYACRAGVRNSPAITLGQRYFRERLDAFAPISDLFGTAGPCVEVALRQKRSSAPPVNGAYAFREGVFSRRLVPPGSAVLGNDHQDKLKHQVREIRSFNRPTVFEIQRYLLGLK